MTDRKLDISETAGGAAPRVRVGDAHDRAIHLLKGEERTSGMLNIRSLYRRRASEAAGYERLKSWVAAASAWEAALSFATGANVYWCRSRQAWCLARSRKG